ncbi:MAG: DUF1189 family protein [Legionella sp.]|nr:DUF1189 family protein [Legionella sp.]
MKRLIHNKNKNTSRKKRNIAHYGFLKAIGMSFFSRRLYVDVVRRWRGYGVFYLLIMLSVVMLPFAVYVITSYQHTINEKLFLPIKQLPPFVMHKGNVYFHSPMPYLVKNSQDQVIAVIDTEGSVKQLPYFLYPEASVLITKHALHVNLPYPDLFKKSGLPEASAKEIVSTFPADETLNFGGLEASEFKYLKTMNYVLIASIYPMLVMFYWGLYFLAFFSFSLFGQFVARLVFKVRLTFKEASRLMAVAATPQAVVYFGLLACNKVYLGMGVFYLGLLALSFSLAVLAYRSDNRAVLFQ